MRDLSARLLDADVDEIDVGETIGVAATADIERLYEGLADLLSPAETCLHLHDTRGAALANVVAGLHGGVTAFDSTAGGLGGCPFAPGASGNLATEDLLHLLHGMGIETGVSLDAVARASGALGLALGKTPPSRARAAWVAEGN